jgi:dTDP-4-amino-4,6-dideoxygalactose transaminase
MPSRATKQLRVPYVDLALQHRKIRDKLLAAVGRVLDSGQFILGPEVETFERRFALYCGVSYAVGVDNGTNALVLTMRALGIGPGDEVITAANSFLASASSVAMTGARPVLVDVDSSYTVDPRRVEDAITLRTKAILPVHLTGRPANMKVLTEIAINHGLYLIEDAAQAIGARHRGQAAGSFGIAGCFSMHPLKVLNAVGDGGIITTNDSQLYKKLLKARNHGLRNRDECEFWGPNARLDAVQAAMLMVKMELLPLWIERRREMAAIYRQNLRDIVHVPEEQSHEYSVYQTFVVRVERRDELQEYLALKGIETKVHYPIPIHLQEAARYLGYLEGSFPVTERQTASNLSLPIYPELSQGQIRHVIESIHQFYSRSVGSKCPTEI